MPHRPHTHTPGPWGVAIYNGKPAVSRDTEMGGLIAVGVTAADARLIAAAPDMLAVLKSIPEWFEMWLPDAIGPAEQALLEKVTAAIVKAER
jgi:hypothetical protein